MIIYHRHSEHDIDEGDVFLFSSYNRLQAKQTDKKKKRPSGERQIRHKSNMLLTRLQTHKYSVSYSKKKQPPIDFQ